MKNKIHVKILFLVITFVIISCKAYGFWEWTPETRKWINPKRYVQDTAKKQFEWAEKLKSAGSKEQAIREYLKLLKHYKNQIILPVHV